MQPLTEKYRPRDWHEVIAQDKAIAKLQTLESRGYGGRAFWITGRSGTGKTTIAKIIAAKVNGLTREIDASALTVDALSAIEDMQHYAGCEPVTWIVNESHGLRKDIVRRLLVILEALKPHTTIIFTTTIDNQAEFEDCHLDANPLLSRCIRIALTEQGLQKAFAARAREIAQAEGLDGQPIARYERLAKDTLGNFRAMLQAIDAGEMLA